MNFYQIISISEIIDFTKNFFIAFATKILNGIKYNIKYSVELSILILICY